MPTFGRTWSSGRRCGHTPTRLYHRPLHKPHPMTALLLPYLLVLVQALVLVLVLALGLARVVMLVLVLERVPRRLPMCVMAHGRTCTSTIALWWWVVKAVARQHSSMVRDVSRLCGANAARLAALTLVVGACVNRHSAARGW